VASLKELRMQMRARTIPLFAAGVLSAAVWLQDAQAQATPAAARLPATWRVKCPFDSTKALLPVTCGRVKLPEDPAIPTGGRFVEIAFMRVTAPRSVDQNGPMVFINGGPGQNSLYFAEQLVTLPHVRDVVVDRDWIFFDQRGTGRSTPSLYCEPDADWFAQVKKCRDRLTAQGIDLAQYNSVRIVGDMEALRNALGLRQWNLWGISYGARVAVIAARAHPTSVRSIILDGSGVPEGQELVDDARGTEAALNKLFAKCAGDSACSAAYPQLRSRFTAALPRLRQTPLQAGDRQYDDGALLRYVRGWLYPRGYSTYEARIQSLLVIMDAAARGDGALLAATRERMRVEEGIGRADPPVPEHARFSTGQNLSVYCHESEPLQSAEEVQRAVSGSVIVRALLQGVGDGSACGLWPSGRAAASSRTGFYDGPQLALTGELDASNSGQSGYKIVAGNTNAKQVVFRNGNHGQWAANLPTEEDLSYRLCALQLGRAFVADPRAWLDTRCAETRPLRLVR
jgi:pimeloyl-ACP methyl ester carboxylesterase